jgi:hypothetical protein
LDNCYRTFGAAPVLDNPDSWISLVMRVAEGTPRITSFDAMTPAGVATNTEVTAWSLEASADGFNWVSLTNYHNTAEVSHHSGRAHWYSDWSNFTNGTNPNRAGKGFQFSGYLEDDLIAPNWNEVKIKVSAGAVLRVNGKPVTISNLTLDASGNEAKIEGVKFAESGSVDISNFTSSVASEKLAVDLSKVENADNLSKWQVSFNGVLALDRKISVRASKAYIHNIGLIINIR